MKLIRVGGCKEQQVKHGSTIVRGGNGPITKGDRLHQAAFNGNLVKVKKLIKDGIDLNCCSPAGRLISHAHPVCDGTKHIIKRATCYRLHCANAGGGGRPR